MERLQRNNPNSAVGRNYAESRFSRHEQDLELLQIMDNEENQDQRQNELNQIAEIVIQRIQDKLRGLEFHNPNKKNEVEQSGISAQLPGNGGNQGLKTQ